MLRLKRLLLVADASAVGPAKIFNEKAEYFGRKIRVHELIRGSLGLIRSIPTRQAVL